MTTSEQAASDVGRQAGPVVGLSGNPRPGSRTLDAATRLAQRLPAAGTIQVVEFAPLAGHMYEPGHARIREALSTVRSAEVHRADLDAVLDACVEHQIPVLRTSPAVPAGSRAR